jgi:hypothetical protein
MELTFAIHQIVVRVLFASIVNANSTPWNLRLQIVVWNLALQAIKR